MGELGAGLAAVAALAIVGALIYWPTLPERRNHSRHLFLQLFATVAASSLIFGLAGGLWLAGLGAPVGAILVAPVFATHYTTGVALLLPPLAMLSVVVLAVRGLVPRWAGHLALALFNVLSAVLFVGSA